ncbi:MAG TPA: GHMP kinase [Candidatus Angelobacter sp.]|nr:GHMP kinase [Candidatus Angelobacter sp.]
MNAGQTIIAHAPCRVDLAGGTMDIWPLYLFHPGAVTVNFAVTVLTRCRIQPLEGRQIRFRSLDTEREEEFSSLDQLCSAKKFKHAIGVHLTRFFAPECGFELETNSESPAGAGISGSSALMIATTAAMAKLTGRELALEKIREIAQNVEAQLIRVPTGCQDYYPALYGGVSAIHLDADGIHHEAVRVAAEELDHRFVLAYTGAPRQSGINNWEVFKQHINGNRRIFRNFEQIGGIARAMHDAVAHADWPEVARLLREEWKLRKTNAPRISTPLIEKLIKAASKAGAQAAKICGAGGGGCVVFLTEPEAKARVADAIRENGGQVLPAMVAREGLVIQ